MTQEVKRNNHDEDNIDIFIESNCKKCRFFDGYDICLNNQNFGTLISERIENCDRHKLFTYKY